MAPKIKSILIKLVSAAGTGYFYATKKNPTNVPHKLALMKVRWGRVGEAAGVEGGTTPSYCPQQLTTTPLLHRQYDPIVRQHVLFTEAKMPKGRGGRRAGKK